MSKYREEFSESLIGFYNDRFELLQTLDTFAAILERALAEQRESIAEAIDDKAGRHESFGEANPDFAETYGNIAAGLDIAARIARDYGKEETS